MPPPSADAPDENIPLQGTHQGETDDPLTSSVRAQTPPDPTPPAEKKTAHDDEKAGAQNESKGKSEDESGGGPSDALGDYQLLHDQASGRHRVRLRPPSEEADAPGGGFREISRHSSPEDMSDALDGQLSDGPRFVVLEDSETGEVFFDREGALGDDWFSGGRFDQATVFEREEEAAAYADDRQGDTP